MEAHTTPQQDAKKDTATIEAVLFMYGAPVSFKRLGDILGCDARAAQELAEALRDAYDVRGAGLTVLIANDAAQIVTHTDQAETIAAFTKKELEGDLSPAALEVLAVIAYRGPIAKPDIEAIRGVNCSFTLRNLLLRGLIERTPHPRDKRTKLYRTTLAFLRGIGVESVADLPEYGALAGDKRIDAILYADRLGDDEESNNTKEKHEETDA